MIRGRVPSRLLASVFALLTPLVAAQSGGDALAPFPAPAAGEQRHVISLDPRPDESLLQLELLIGKTLQVDCNRQSLLGTVRRETVDGWGYDYWRVTDVAGPASTLMACPEAAPAQAFVVVGGGPHWVRYNSKLPVVVYVPEDLEVRYRLWSTTAEAVTADRR